MEKKSVKELKELLKAKGLPVSGTKDVLIERLKNASNEDDAELVSGEEREMREEMRIRSADCPDDNDDNDDNNNNDEKERKHYKTMSEDEIKEELNTKTLPELKDILRRKDLSVNGKKDVLINRLAGRIVKEQDPFYVAKPKKKVKICEWCGGLMIKRNGRKGEFYGCEAYPSCQYTTSLSGYAKPSREVLRGVPDDRNGYSGCDRLTWAKIKGDREDRIEREQERRDEKLYRNL